MNKNILKTGTTTVGIVCKDGIVLAADKRASAGYMVVNKKERKVVKINDDIAITTAGLVSDIQLLTKLIRAQLKLLEVRNGKKVTIKQAANIMANMVYNSIRRPSMIPSIVGFLFAGRDDRGFHLYEIGIDGSLMLSDEYAADGSGMQFAIGTLEANYRKDITVTDGIKLAVKTVNTALQRDIATGNGIDVFTITNKGVELILEKEVVTKVIL
jgi:proteasome beta subunit